MKTTTSAIALMSIAMLNLVSNVHSTSHKDIATFVSAMKREVGVEEVSMMLKRAAPNDLVGAVSVKELSRLDSIKIYHCTKDELDARKSICDRVVEKGDAPQFCTSRFEELVEFCTERFEDVVRAANKHLSRELRNSVNNLIGKVSDLKINRPTQELRKAVEKYIDRVAMQLRPTVFGERCLRFKEALSSADTILEYGNKKFAELAIYSDFLFDQYKFYELCQAYTEKFAY